MPAHFGIGRVAPYHSCVKCYRGDTETAIFTHGEAEWHIAVLERGAGLSQAEAAATFENFCNVELGTDPGYVRSGIFHAGFRLCQQCADKTGVPLALVKDVDDGKPVNCIVQPEHLYLKEGDA